MARLEKLVILAAAALVVNCSSSAWAQTRDTRGVRNGESQEPMSLAQATGTTADTTRVGEETRTTIREDAESSWGITGPISLRSADPEEPGELEVKNIFGWQTSRNGESDEWEYELELEYGLVENHELILEVPFELGDGRVDGNGDLTLGWHWRLFKEQDWLPAFAMRNYVRTPTGIGSEGVDYEWRGLFTKTIMPEKCRLHWNPYLKSVNGDNEPDARHFQWGSLIGMDYRVCENVLFIWDYHYRNGEIEHTRDQHSLELGVDWKIVEHHTIGVATEVGLDGDSQGAALGAKVSYILSF